MARPRFSDFLANRRRQLGLTVPQAARVLRLKEQVIVAFEEGDWDRIPRSGYAQGMLSSYARYLGLNPREVIDLFQEDLAAYAGEAPQDHGSRRSARTPAVPRSDRTSDRDLYGPAGPAGSILTGTLVGNSYLHHSGEPTSSPLVNGRNAGYSERYLRQNGYATPGAEGCALPAPAGRDYPQGRPYTGRTPRRSSQSASRTAGRSLPPARVAGRDRSPRAREEARRYSSSDIQTRHVSQGMYDDDLRYGMASDSYRQASSREVRESVRTSTGTPQRPNIRRRPSADTQAQLRGARTGAPRRSGVLGVVEAWFSDPNRTMATMFVALFIVLVVVIALSVKSCTTPVEEGGNRQQVQVVQADPSENSQDDSATKNDDASADASNDAAAKTAKDDGENQGPVEVKVSVPDGGAVWVEVTNGGTNAVAQTVTGPWEQTFTVDGELEVRTADPSQVTVTANGDPVSFTTSAAGVGTLTVKGPAKDDTGDSGSAKDTDANSNDADGGDQGDDTSSSGDNDSGSGSSGSSSQGSGSGSSNTGTASSSGSRSSNGTGNSRSGSNSQ